MKKKFGIALLAFLLLSVITPMAFGFTGDENTITVEPIKIEGKIGDKGVFDTTIVDELLKDKGLVYESKNESIITVDDKGNWEAKNKGETEITVSFLSEDTPIKTIPVTITEVAKVTGKANISPRAGNVIPDPSLKAAINDTLGRPVTTDVTISDMESLITFQYSGPYALSSTEPRLTSFEGMQYGINIVQFSAYYADLSNPESTAALAALTQLEQLDLSFCNLTSGSLAHLGNLTNLKQLYVPFNQLDSLNGLEPLFESVHEQFLADPDTYNFYFYASRNPIVDFTGGKALFDYKKDYNLHFGLEENQAVLYAANEVIRSISPHVYELNVQFDPNWIDYAGYGSERKPIKLPDIWSLRINESSSPEKNRLLIKNALVDYNGDKMIFGTDYKWEDDIGASSLMFPFFTRADELFTYTELLTNGYNASPPFQDTIEDYFQLVTRDSFEYPGETEYYYEGRDYNIVPYNPKATGPANRQSSFPTADGRDASAYYVEFKNFNDPVPLPDDPAYYYPNMFSNTADTSTIHFSARPMVGGADLIPIYNSFGAIGYEQVVHWINPDPPVIDGLVNLTLTAGTAFDPLAGVTAYDPTRDEDNPDGTTPKDITSSIVIVSGSVDIHTPGTYVITYKVISPYGIETIGERTITVVADNNGGGNGGNGTAGGGTLPSTGTDGSVLLGTLFLLAGLAILYYIKINRKDQYLN